MLRFIVGLLLLSSCSLGVLKKGGDKPYVYDVDYNYTIDELEELAPSLIITSTREPQTGTLKNLFSEKQDPLKRIGIMVFETSIQPTRSGLSNEDMVFLSAQGKQLLTEKLLSIWEQSLPLLGAELEYVKTSKIKKTKAFKTNGMNETDHILSKREALAPDDIFFLPKGKKTTMDTILNPRGMKDFSLAMVPATELMSGPKFSEHAKHALNDLCKELKLDAVIIVMSHLSWSSAHVDKHSGEVFMEEAKIGLKSSILVPLSEYHKRLKRAGEERNLPSTTIAFRTYESTIKIPVKLNAPVEEQNFNYIEKEVLNPVVKTYNDLSHMMQMQMINDLEKKQK